MSPRDPATTPTAFPFVAGFALAAAGAVILWPSADPDLERYRAVRDWTRQAYVRPVGDEQLMDDALRGLADGLDSWSSWYDRGDLARLDRETEGRFHGLGVSLRAPASDGRILFPEKLTSSKSSGSGLSGSKSTSGDKNPLFGMTTYLVLNAVFRHTYLRRTIPGDLLDRVGTTVDRLPESFPTPAGRNWLVMPPRAGKRGNVFEISEEWTLSKPGEKWPDAIYGLIQR
jgi:hypothetical protein